MTLVVESFPVGPLACNCTVLGDTGSGRAVVIDPGGDAEKIMGVLARHGLTCEHLVHTHAHIDHILATRAIKERTGATIHLHDGDLPLYEGILEQAAMLAGWGLRIPPPDPTVPVDQFLKDGDAVSAGALELEVLHTPGHTPGSCCFGVDDGEHGLLIAGDTLFRGSIGRTDLPGGDPARIVRSIQQRIYTRGEGTHVITGHGEATTVGAELRGNAFVRGVGA